MAASRSPARQPVRTLSGTIPSAWATQVETSRRVTEVVDHSRVGCTEFVSSTTTVSVSGSMTSEVPVKPVCTPLYGLVRPAW